MKYIKSKCLQKSKGKKKGKYLLTLEVTDNDLDMLEDFATTYAPFQLWQDVIDGKITMNEFNQESIKCDFNKTYRKWVMKTWREFWKLWRLYDE